MRHLHLVLSLTFVLTGCGLDLGVPATPQLYSLDGVKLLVQSNDKGQDPSTFLQATYSIDPSHRLLLRFENLETQVGSVDLSQGKTVQMRLAVPDASQTAAAISTLKLYPVTRPWMMLASWDYAFPFGDSGRWKQPGGDFDSDGGVVAVLSPDDARVLNFDVTQWFLDYPRGRSVNYGLILTSSTPVTVVGDTNGTYSPRIAFDSISSGRP